MCEGAYVRSIGVRVMDAWPAADTCVGSSSCRRFARDPMLPAEAQHV